MNSCPRPHEQQAELAHKLGVPVEKVARRVAELHEFNPMLGHRGCRLGIVYPEISAMQARAIFEAAIEVQKEGIKVKPEIMIPLVGFREGARAADRAGAPDRGRGEQGAQHEA